MYSQNSEFATGLNMVWSELKEMLNFWKCLL